MSSLTNTILNSPNKSTMIAELIKSFAQQESNTTLCRMKIQWFMQNKTATWHDMKFQRSRIVFNAHKANDNKVQAKHFAVVAVCSQYCRRGQEAGKATNQQSIHHLRPWHSRVRTEEHPQRSTLWKICRITELKKARDHLGSAKKQNHGTIVERYLEDKQCRMRMVDQGNTQTDVVDFDRKALGQKNYAPTLEERRYYKDHCKVMQSKQQHLEDRRKEKLTSHHRDPYAEHMDMDTFHTFFLEGLFLIIATMTTDTKTYLTWLHSTRPEQWCTF